MRVLAAVFTTLAKFMWCNTINVGLNAKNGGFVYPNSIFLGSKHCFFYLRINIETDIILNPRIVRENLDKIQQFLFFIKTQKLTTILNM